MVPLPEKNRCTWQQVCLFYFSYGSCHSPGISLFQVVNSYNPSYSFLATITLKKGLAVNPPLLDIRFCWNVIGVIVDFFAFAFFLEIICLQIDSIYNSDKVFLSKASMKICSPLWFWLKPDSVTALGFSIFMFSSRSWGLSLVKTPAAGTASHPMLSSSLLSIHSVYFS